MALGDGGLDAQVEQRMDAYRGDPKKLQQRYGQNKELLDLLALQKLTAEKKQVAADMQMKAQQNPNTIAQQREQEALELTKQEMGGTLGQLAANTKSTLDQKQAMQQKNMGKLAQNASRPQPGPGAGLAGLMGGAARPPARPPVNPQAAGLANARMVQAARGGPIKMAQGGIVAFQEGGSAFGDSAADLSGYGKAFSRSNSAENVGDAIRQYYADYGVTNQDQWDRTPADAKKRITSAVKAKIGASGVAATLAIPFAELNDLLVDPFKAISNVGIAASNTGLGAALGLSDPRNPNELYQYNTERKRTQDTIAANMTPEGGIKLPSGPTARSGEFVEEPMPQLPGMPTARPMPDEGAGIAALPTEPSVPALENPSMTAPAPADTSTSAPQSSSGVDMNTLMSNMGFSAEDPNAALQRGFTEADAYTGRAEKAAKYDDMIAEMAEFDAENYDPDRERRDRLKSFLMGAAGTTNIGTTFASAGAASMNLANSQRKARRSRLMDKFNMEKDKMTTDTGLAQSGLTLGRELYSQAQQNQRSALQAGVQMRGQDLQNAQKNADRLLRKVEGDNTQAYRAATIALEENKLDLATLKEENATEAARVTAANNTIFRTLQVREQISAEANALAGVEVAQTELENAELMGLEPAQIKVLQEKFDKAAALALVMTEDMMNKFGRGTDKDGNRTGTSLLDAEQFAIQVLGQYGIAPTIGKDSVTSRTYNE